jgi:hypothetical protein
MLWNFSPEKSDGFGRVRVAAATAAVCARMFVNSLGVLMVAQ